MAIDVVRTTRNTWHVIDRNSGTHWEAADQAEVESSIAAYKQALEDQKAAEEAAANAPNEVSEYGDTVPGEAAVPTAAPTAEATVARGN